MPDDVYIVKATWDLGVPIIDYRITENNMNDNQDNITAEAENPDMVNHPPHYTEGPSLGELECIDITRWMPFTLGNAFKYVWRAGKKNPAAFAEDLEKALFYMEDWKLLEQWHATLYRIFSTPQTLFFKADLSGMELWRRRALTAIVLNRVDEAQDEIDEQIKAAELAADEAFRRYEPEDETDDPD